MPPRKARIPVVFDTNVIIGYYLSKAARSASIKVFRLLQQKVSSLRVGRFAKSCAFDGQAPRFSKSRYIAVKELCFRCTYGDMNENFS